MACRFCAVFPGIFEAVYVEVFGLHGGIARKSGKLVLGIHLHRKQKRSYIHFRCTEGSKASAEGAKLCFGLGGEDRRHAPMGKSVFFFFLKNGPVFNDFVAFFVHFPAVFATALAVVRPIKPDCYHCLRIHIFVWKTCVTVDKRHIAPQGGSGGMRPLEDFYVHFGHFPTAFFDLTLIGVNGRVGKGTCSAGNLFLVLVYKMSKPKSQIFMAYRRFYFNFYFIFVLR